MKRTGLIVFSFVCLGSISALAQGPGDPTPNQLKEQPGKEELLTWLADSNLLTKASPDEEKAHAQRIRRLHELRSQSEEAAVAADENAAGAETDHSQPNRGAVQQEARVASGAMIAEPAGAGADESMERLIEAVEQLEMQVRELNQNLNPRPTRQEAPQGDDSLLEPQPYDPSLDSQQDTEPAPQRFRFRVR